MPATVIENGLVCTGVDGEKAFEGTVILLDGVVHAVCKCGSADYASVLSSFRAAHPDAETIDAKGKIVIPGGIDPHVHLQYPQGGFRIYSCDDFHTGSVAAVCGGTTTLIDFVEPCNDRQKGTEEPMIHALESRRAEAEGNAVTDYSFHMTVNRDDGGDEDKLAAEIAAVADAGVTSFKMYTAYDGIRLTDPELVRAMRALAKCKCLPIVHCENHALIMDRVASLKQRAAAGDDTARAAANQPLTRCVQGEAEATARIALLAEAAGCTAGCHIVHVTAKAALPTLKTAQFRDLENEMGPITGEVCSQHLELTEDVYRNGGHEKGCDYICAPPMRPQRDIDAMWEALNDGTLLFTVTDHCPFTKAQRRGLRRVPEFRKTWDAETGAEKVIDVAAGETNEQRDYEKWWKEVGDGKKHDIPAFFEMPGGVPGIETRLMLLYDGVHNGKMTLERFVQVTSTAAAKRYNMYPQKGLLAPGSDADVTIFDPNAQTTISAKTLHQNCDFTPYEGRTVHMAVTDVFARGDRMVKNGKYVGESCHHRGKFIPRKPYL